MKLQLVLAVFIVIVAVANCEYSVKPECQYDCEYFLIYKIDDKCEIICERFGPIN